jgi:hypothetical protein
MLRPASDPRRNGMARRSPPRKVTYFEPVPPRLARNTIIESTFDVGRRFRCTMRVDCGQLDPGAVIRPIRGEWHPRMPESLDEEELADWRAGRNAVYQLAGPDRRRAPRGCRRITRHAFEEVLDLLARAVLRGAGHHRGEIGHEEAAGAKQQPGERDARRWSEVVGQVGLPSVSSVITHSP